MALAGGVAAGAAAPCWVLASRAGEWGEVLIFGRVMTNDFSLGLTTDDAGTPFARVLVRLLPGHCRAAMVLGGGAPRAPPFGAPIGSANW
eukprot:9478796-Pyramimonas_sp.AAC.1